MSEVRTVSETGGEKGSKPARFDLIPAEPLWLLAQHYGVGSLKYDDDNWRCGYDWKYSYAALQRHANEWWLGREWGVEEFVHRETGETIRVVVNHMIAVAWHAFALYWFSQNQRNFAPAQFAQTHSLELSRAAYLPETVATA